MNIDTKVYRKHESPTFGNTLLGEDVGLSKRFISFSGGVESTTMCILFGKGAKAIWCDTGAEHEEMYATIDFVEAKLKELEVFNMDVDLPAINSVMAIGDIDLVQPHMLSKPRVTRELFCVKDHIVSKDELISDNTPKIVEDETN